MVFSVSDTMTVLIRRIGDAFKLYHYHLDYPTPFHLAMITSLDFVLVMSPVPFFPQQSD